MAFYGRHHFCENCSASGSNFLSDDCFTMLMVVALLNSLESAWCI